MPSLKGGFSVGVVETPVFSEYASTGVGGYIHDANRTKVRDRAIEKALREHGLQDYGIATWLTSTSARHMMDCVNKKTTMKDFKTIADDYACAAFIQVTVWSHPDHRGSLASSKELTLKIARAFREVET